MSDYPLGSHKIFSRFSIIHNEVIVQLSAVEIKYMLYVNLSVFFYELLICEH